MLGKNRVCPKEIVLATSIFSLFSVILSIAVGRSQFTAWYPHLKVHYGISTAMLIPLGLLLLERISLAKKYFSGIFVVIFGMSYALALQFQVAYLNSVKSANLAAIQRLAYSTDLSDTISKHWLDYWWRNDDTELASDLAMRISFMRSHGGRIYLPWD